MKQHLRWPLYVGLVLIGILTAILKKDDQFGLVLGMLGVVVGLFAIHRWSQYPPPTDDANENSDESQ